MAEMDGEAFTDGDSLLTYRHSVLGLTMASGFLFFSARTIIPPLAVPIQEAVGIGNTEFGIALTGLWATYALMQFPGGTVSDDLGHRTLLVVSMVLLCLGLLLFSVITSFASFLIATTVIGAGGGIFMIVRFRLLSVLYGENKGRAFGISEGFMNLAGVIAPAAITVLIGLIAWELAFLALGGSMLVMAMAFHKGINEPYSFQKPPIKQAVVSSLAKIRSGYITLLIVVNTAYSIAVQSITAFVPLYMLEAKGLTFQQSGMMLSLYFLIGVFMRPIAGWASDVLDRRLTAAFALIGSGSMLGFLIYGVESFYLVAVSFALFSAALLSFAPAMDAYFLDIFDGSQMGASFGLVRTITIFIGSTGPTLVGAGSEILGYNTTFGLLAASIVVAGGILVISPIVAAPP